MSQKKTNQYQEGRVIFQFEKTQIEKIQFTLYPTKDNRFSIDLRQYFLDMDTGQFRPTKKGIRLDQSFLKEIGQGIQKIKEALDAE